MSDKKTKTEEAPKEARPGHTFLTMREAMNAFGIWNQLKQFSFKNHKGRHGVNRNCDHLEKLNEVGKQTLEEIRDQNIKQDKDGKPKLKYLVKDGKRQKDAAGNDIPTDWDWKKGGKEAAEEAQRIYLDETVEEVKVHTVKQSWLEPCYRYISQGQGTAGVREEVYLSGVEEAMIEYALDFDLVNEDD